MAGERLRVVIVGAGFGGLAAARALRDAPVDVLVIDRHNYHTFVPLLYQVATAGLEAEEVAQPVRRILRGQKNARFLLADVRGFDLDRRVVVTETEEVSYDRLIIAAGSVTAFFGLDVSSAVTLRELDDAEAVRDRVLEAFEQASSERDPARRQELMTIVIVGGGPTGVELAGAIAELRRHVLPKDYPALDLSSSRVVLVEAADRLLPGMPPRLQGKALERLSAMQVEVRLESAVTGVRADGVRLGNGERIGAGVVIWVAGVAAAPLASGLPGAKAAAGRVIVSETLQLSEHPDVYVIGDMAAVSGQPRPHPMLAPVAIQQGTLAGKNALASLEGREQRSFRYRDRGSMATIGRHAAVAHVLGIDVNGFVAWLMWLTVHLVWLIGFRNKALVLVNWAWNYFTYDRAARLIRRRSKAGRNDRVRR